MRFVFFFQAEDGIRDADVTGVQTCALPISEGPNRGSPMMRPFWLTSTPRIITIVSSKTLNIPVALPVSQSAMLDMAEAMAPPPIGPPARFAMTNIYAAGIQNQRGAKASISEVSEIVVYAICSGSTALSVN